MNEPPGNLEDSYPTLSLMLLRSLGVEPNRSDPEAKP